VSPDHSGWPGLTQASYLTSPTRPLRRSSQEGGEPAGLTAARALLAGAPVVEELIQEALGVAMLIHCPICRALQAQELTADDGCTAVVCESCKKVRGGGVHGKA
jgi:hypothetical protein